MPDVSGPMEMESSVKFTEKQIIPWASQKPRVDALGLREDCHFLQMGASRGKANVAGGMQV